MSNMRLESSGRVIRQAEERDARLLCDWWNDGDVMAHAGFPDGLGTTEREVAERLRSDSDACRRLLLEIDGLAVGEMNYRTVAAGEAEIGIKLCDPAARDRGNGTAFLRMLIAYLFEEAGYERIRLDTNLQNTRAQHVYEKLGFRRTSVHINAWKDQRGLPQSMVDYELTRAAYASAYPSA
jgi:RimJ/RimL family protein N-acetyltransferase